MSADGVTLQALADALGAELIGDSSVVVSSIAALDKADANAVSFLGNPKYAPQLKTTQAAAVLVAAKPDHDVNCALIITPNPSLAFSKLADVMGLGRPVPEPGIHETAIVHPDVTLGDNVTIMAYAVIAEGVTLGNNCTIYPHSYIGENVTMGDDCVVYPNCSIMDGTLMGNRVIINANTVVGCDGFGFDIESAENIKIPQLGIVELQDDVDLGSCVTIDRARFEKTIIGAGTKIDNQVQIGHNVQTGKNNILVSQAGLAGSTTTGERVILAAGAGTGGHMHLADYTVGAARAGFTKSTPQGGIYAGYPAQSADGWRKEIANLRKMDTMRRSLKALEKRLESLEQHVKTQND